jgi:Family of unknown function (DUF5522)
VDDTDIFDADGALTARFLAQRGYCCANGCRNCPYLPRHGGLEAVLPAGGWDEEKQTAEDGEPVQ